MGSTPREHTLQIPMPTRGSEIGGCYGRTVLSYLREDEQKPASFFILGDVLHRTIENAINYDADVHQSMLWMEICMAQELEKVKGMDIVQGEARDMESIMDDARRMLHNWYRFVHPDSDKRHPAYDDWQWPPRTEVQFARDAGTRFGVWGSVDALFQGQDRHLIVDWKSGNKRPETDFQLNYYRFGLEVREAAAHYHMLDRVRAPSVVVEAAPYPGDLSIKNAISLTEQAKQGTVQGQMPKFSPGWQCGYCPVQHLCPVDGHPRNRPANEKALRKLLKRVEPLYVLPE